MCVKKQYYSTIIYQRENRFSNVLYLDDSRARQNRAIRQSRNLTIIYSTYKTYIEISWYCTFALGIGIRIYLRFVALYRRGPQILCGLHRVARRMSYYNIIITYYAYYPFDGKLTSIDRIYNIILHIPWISYLERFSCFVPNAAAAAARAKLYITVNNNNNRY